MIEARTRHMDDLVGLPAAHCQGRNSVSEKEQCHGDTGAGTPDPPGTECTCLCTACIWQKGFTAGYRQCKQDNEAAANDERFP